MPKVTFLPMNQTVEAKSGQTLLQIALDHDIPMSHACGGFCACTTCHCLVKKGLETLSSIQEDEEERLDRATGVTLQSRLGCQTELGDQDVVIQVLHEGLGH